MSELDFQNALSRDASALLKRLGVSGLADVFADSRETRRGSLFLAYPGTARDGRQYIQNAITQGAAAALWEDDGTFCWNADWTIPNLPARNLKFLEGAIAQELAGRPSEQISLAAVTGTNGKTSVSQWIARSWPERCAVIGTLGAGFPDDLISTGLTTPTAADMARLLREFSRNGAKACALEASSIGIEEGRLNGLSVRFAIFTNFSRDHLDYHGTMACYAAAKERLFGWPGLKCAIINIEDALGRRIAQGQESMDLLTYRVANEEDPPEAHIEARDLAVTPAGQTFTLLTPWGTGRVATGLSGRFNIANLLAVAAVLLAAGLPLRETVTRLENLSAPSGRMERLSETDDSGRRAPLILVDYAHTPDALLNALAALRPLADARGGRLICVFGCGGNRDPGKRPKMGEIAAQTADALWVTSDNPRDEEPEAIIADILKGEGVSRAARVEPDRAAAITRAIADAAPEDVLLIAGKGHEDYQEICGIRHPFSDREAARQALQARVWA
ncbi:MAG: UDP-N-acetylmuramoyl-L-alanyl-D-glutamate--2,6-diaminopimelate ligase [Zoogloeaceae bacterium]|jgi:UDP-N-acetylmuramyl-tripeptide synthetase|nr:UDP-N-acetylmuramoyl-L-alanyl-D-glutamate--2,6-diaminopimelate ligase [Zoogloeaceae bacterium]